MAILPGHAATQTGLSNDNTIASNHSPKIIINQSKNKAEYARAMRGIPF